MSLEVTLTDSSDLGARYLDVLEVTGSVHDPDRDSYDDQGNFVPFTRAVTAHGWVSAEKHFYPPEAYTTDANGQLMLVPGATPREMTSEEKAAYETNLLITEFNNNYS